MACGAGISTETTGGGKQAPSFIKKRRENLYEYGKSEKGRVKADPMEKNYSDIFDAAARNAVFSD